MSYRLHVQIEGYLAKEEKMKEARESKKRLIRERNKKGRKRKIIRGTDTRLFFNLLQINLLTRTRESWRDVGRLEDFQDLPMQRVSARKRLYQSADDEHGRRIRAVMSTAVAVLVALRDASIRVTPR
jgi:hypothetical protein